MISYLPNSFNDGAQPDISWAKLAYHAKSRDALGWGHLKENLVSHFKLQRPAPWVRIALLLTLGRFYLFLDYFDLLGSCLY